MMKSKKYTGSFPIVQTFEAAALKCRICDNQENNQNFVAREMMFGTKDEFAYFECGRCGCLQIVEFPESMARYYPQAFFGIDQDLKKKKVIKDVALALNQKISFLHNDRMTLKLISSLFPHSNILNIIRKTNTMLNSRILEVGCGKGTLMLALKKWGFRKITGIDPYSCEKIDKNLEILKMSIHELPASEKYDLVIFDHSYEHIPDQFETLAKVSTILTKKGTCVIRMPVKTDYIWKRYGLNWVQLDAPRHFFIHTLESIRLLAEKGNLQIESVVFDSTEFQFWGSEQYKENIPLRAENSYSVNPQNSMFTEEDIVRFREMARELNAKFQGDQAEFYLKKK